ncbi:class I SAM-dependent methyltransferase [Paenibacillus lutimineralis]|uniref:Methyltransferase domain-containing protein n=1 Tax=Paenibacillus lutimineralis TaxID=2707005 RepID=A0A3Q9I6F3_9BACL|nr:methyltransferase domain-containing protein [Paenibacillus lutimineralis]AZS13681.1 methyltransferase domain-containing protein [Paenibacillus lutimineralis]
MEARQVWNAKLYDTKFRFVSEYGKDVLELLNAQVGEEIIDLGCGTGDISYEIAKTGAVVSGFDLSETMIQQARLKYPDLKFKVQNAAHFSVERPVQAVFSNAALHWVKDAGNVVKSVYRALDCGGRFIAEFGGKGNVDLIVQHITKVLDANYGIDAKPLDPWYFPSLGEYSSLLEEHGFRVTYAVHFDRPTKLEGGAMGMQHWLRLFAEDSFLYSLSEPDKEQAIQLIAKSAEQDLLVGGEWYGDYKRLRIVAIKEET